MYDMNKPPAYSPQQGFVAGQTPYNPGYMPQQQQGPYNPTYIPQQQGIYGQPPQNVVIVAGSVGTCPYCRVGYPREDFSCCGIFCAIFFFPIGILCCLAMRETTCSHCGRHL